MMKNTDVEKSFEETLPTLYRDIKFIDNDGFAWFPMFFDAHPVGLVMADGTTKDNWEWSVVPYVLVKPEEREKFKMKDGTYAKYKTDISKAVRFPQDQFANALDALNELHQ